MSHWSKDAIIERATDEIIEMPMDEILSFIYDKGSYSDEKHTNSLCEQIIDIAIEILVGDYMNKSPY